MPIFEKVVEEETWRVRGAVGGFFGRAAKASAQREKGHRIASVERVRVGEGEGAEDVGKVAAGFVENAVLKCGQVVAAVSGKRVFVDCDDCAVFAKEKPGPDTVAVGQVVFIENIAVVRGTGVLCAVEGIVPKTNIAPSEVDARVVP